MIKLNAQDVNAIGVILPLLVGYLSHWSSSSRAKAILLAVLAVISAGVTTVTQAHSVVTQQLVVNFAIQYGLAVLTHYGFWKPTGASGTLLNNGLGLFKNNVATVQKNLLDAGILVAPASSFSPSAAEQALELAKTLLDQKS